VLQFLDVLGLLQPREPPEDGLAGLDPEMLVGRETRVGFGGDAGQVVLQVGHERAGLRRQANLFSVPGHIPRIFGPRDELATIVRILVAPLDAEVTGLEFSTICEKRQTSKCLRSTSVGCGCDSTTP